MRKVNEIAVQGLVVRHTLDGFSHVLVVLDRLDETAIFVEDLLDLRRTWGWRAGSKVHKAMRN